MIETFHNYINGEWLPAVSGRTTPDTNPADTRDVIGHYAASAPEDVRRAADAAEAALPGWRALAGPQRAKYLEQAASLMESRLEEIARDLTREEGKTLTESRGETARGAAILRYYAGECWRASGEVIPASSARVVMFTRREPLGVVAAITPWNFPVAVPIWKIAPALAFGNTVVFKPAALTPAVAVRIAQVFESAGLPKGVFNLLTGSGGEIGQELVSDPSVKGVSFTGSNAVGQKIGAWAVQRGIKFQLEMGGKNPVIVAADADLDQAVELTVSGAMRSAGQKCTATSRAVVVESVLDEFVDRVVRRVQSLKVGPGTDETTYLGPLVSEQQLQTVLDYIQSGADEGAEMLCGGVRLQGELYAHGFYVQPTVFANVSPRMKIAREEIFGPVLAVLSAADLDEAIEIANGVPYGLSASLFTRDLGAAMQYISRIEAGMVRVNGETAGVELQAPFGGMKASSSHSREQGRAAIEFFTETKTISLEPAGDGK